MPDLSVWPTDGGDGSVSSEARWRKMARLWVPSGVATPTDLAPTLAAGPTVNVTTGACWMDGHYAELTAPASVPASANGLLVVRFTPADNHAELLYRDGASSPTQTDPTWELPIAQMAAGAMTDRRVKADPGGAPLVTALPAFPIDGQTVRYYNAATGQVWTLVYVAAAPGPYRWAFAGGQPLWSYVITAETLGAANVWTNLATVGPDVVCPLAGLYNLEFGARLYGLLAAQTEQIGAAVVPSTSPPWLAVAQNVGTGAANVGWSVASAQGPTATVVAGDRIRLFYQSSVAGSGFFAYRYLLATPLRVG